MPLRTAATFLRLLCAAAVLAFSAGCINLPPALERELACAPASTPDNFGSAAACASAAR